MNNQHEKIKGYRDLSQEEINLMNELKEKEAEIGQIFQHLRHNFNPDERWLAIARTDLQKGFMGAVRAIAKPNSSL